MTPSAAVDSRQAQPGHQLGHQPESSTAQAMYVLLVPAGGVLHVALVGGVDVGQGQAGHPGGQGAAVHGADAGQPAAAWRCGRRPGDGGDGRSERARPPWR